jgi:ubiquinone/menaquinone biosynthesis C-methylase UbiE
MSDDPLSQHERTRNEFTRQVATFESAAAMADGGVLERLAEAADLRGTSSVLDLACGPGLVAERLARDARSVVAFDLTRAMLERACERAQEAGAQNLVPTLGAAEALPFRRGAFDAVVTRLALHHALDPRAVILESARVLRPGGRAVIADIVCSDEPERAELHNALERLRDPSHVRMLGRTELISTIQAAGLEILDVHEWSTLRHFSEWMHIANAPDRAEPLEAVMRALADAKLDAGIDLHVDEGEPAFSHRWVLVAARRGELQI